MNQKLGTTARKLIRAGCEGLVGAALKARVKDLAGTHDVSEAYIYKMTADQRSGKRKKRSDAGRRTFELIEGTDVWNAAQLVIHDKLDPDQALLTIRTRNADAKLPQPEYFRQMLAEVGLGKKARRTAKRGFRRWEAEFPGQIFQIDVTALKVRWEDMTTRRILRIEGVDKNHPQMDKEKLRVWQIMAVDDHSRVRFLRYITTLHITSAEMVRFECELFSRYGVPHQLYTDNGSEFKGYHIRAERILNRILEKDGGYRHVTHMPGNAQATGKVEGAHKWAEKMDRYVGLAVSEGQTVTIEDLNHFADSVCKYYNEVRVHRATGQRPMDRWHAKRVVVRKLPADIIESALLSDEFECVLDPSMTVKHRGVAYVVPGVQPFVDYVGQKVKIVVPPSIDLILMTLPNGAGEYEIEKVIATADKAGEFKSLQESKAQTLTKRLKDTRKEQIKGIKTLSKQTGEIAPIPHYNVEISVPESNITHFPQAERVVTHEEIAAVVPIPEQQQKSSPPEQEGWPQAGVVDAAYCGREIGYWQAVAEYSDRFANIDECKSWLEANLYPEQQGAVAEADLVAAIERRHEIRNTGLRAVG